MRCISLLFTGTRSKVWFKGLRGLGTIAMVEVPVFDIYSYCTLVNILHWFRGSIRFTNSIPIETLVGVGKSFIGILLTIGDY